MSKECCDKEDMTKDKKGDKEEGRVSISDHGIHAGLTVFIIDDPDDKTLPYHLPALVQTNKRSK